MRQADINWLPNHLLKDIPEIKVVYEEANHYNYGGYYTKGTNRMVVVDDGENIASTIAHEFRHFLQDTKGLLRDNPTQWEIKGTYEESIHRYFWQSWEEMDALLFQYKYANDEVTDWWLNKLVMRN